MKKFVLIAIACVAMTLAGCNRNLSPSQKYGVRSIEYQTANRLVITNQAHISDSDLQNYYPLSREFKSYLDTALDILTDGDPTNDTEADILLDYLGNDLLPRLNEMTGVEHE